MKPTIPLNQSHTQLKKPDEDWAKEALKSTIDICVLNATVVNAGLFPSYLHEMESGEELKQFKQFLDALATGRRLLYKRKA